MKLLINAFNLASAGGLNVALNFLKHVQELRSKTDIIHVVVPSGCGYEALDSGELTFHYLPEALNHWLTRPYMDTIWYPRLLKRVNPDIIFTMGNYPSPVHSKQVVLLQMSHFAYPNDRVLWQKLGTGIFLRIRLRAWVLKKRFKFADILLVQTQTMRIRLRQVYPQLPPVHLFPNAYTLLDNQTNYELPVRKQDGFIYLLCLSRYYRHKNLEIFVEVARIIKARDLPYRIFITIEAQQHHKAQQLLTQIARESLGSILIHIGNVPTDCMSSIYQQVDGLILPTLLESFSGTYVDAMHFGVSIFTSQRDFAEEVCGESAFYFDPLSAQDIVDTIHAGFTDETLRQRKIAEGRKRSMTLPDWPEVSRQGWELLKSLGERAETEVRLQK